MPSAWDLFVQKVMLNKAESRKEKKDEVKARVE